MAHSRSRTKLRCTFTCIRRVEHVDPASHARKTDRAHLYHPINAAHVVNEGNATSPGFKATIVSSKQKGAGTAIMLLIADHTDGEYRVTCWTSFSGRLHSNRLNRRRKSTTCTGVCLLYLYKGRTSPLDRVGLT